jgi:histone deacetylase 1/2
MAINETMSLKAVTKLGVDNYSTWAPRMEFLLRSKGLWKYTHTPPNATAAQQSEDNKALGLIGLSVDDMYLTKIASKETTIEAWGELKSIFEAKSKVRMISLMREFNSLRMVNETIVEYISRATKLADLLKTTGKTLTDDDVIVQVLTGLPDTYDMVRTVLENSTEKLDLDKVQATLMQQEHRLAITSSSTSSDLALHTRVNMETSVPATTPAQPPRRFNNNNNFNHPYNSGPPSGAPYGGSSGRPYNLGAPRQETRRCNYCKKKGHLIKDCRKRKEADARRNAAGGGAGGDQSPYQKTYALAAFNGSTIKSSSAATNFPYLPADCWVLDSGATHHITYDLKDLYKFNTFNVCEAPVITTANGSTTVAEASGLVVFRESLTDSRRIVLQNVLYCPTATVKLFSVQRAAQNGAKFVFNDDSCYMYIDSDLMAVAERIDQLYVIRSSTYRQKGAALAAVTTSSNGNGNDSSDSASTTLDSSGAQIWHRRYGHLGYQNLARLPSMVSGMDLDPNSISDLSDAVCEPCVMGKQVRLPFPSSESTSTKPLELVHMDLCGPIKESLGGKRYVATFIDDYSKYSIVRLLAYKDEVCEAIETTLTYMEKQSGYSVIKVRTDNGGEYVNYKVDNLFNHKGIQHQKTMPHSPQQNGVAERNNRTLMDKVRPMLVDSGLPFELWGEAVVTANYLRNLSPMADMVKTPWEAFWGYKPDVSHLRVFGCAAYAKIPDASRTKLQVKSTKGYFVGYAEHSKGYRIYNPDTKKVMLSRDVIFDESNTSESSARVSNSSSSAASQPTATRLPVTRLTSDSAVAQRLPITRLSTAASAPQQPSDQSESDATPTPAPGKVTRRGTAYVSFVEEPTSYEQALRSDQAELWLTAINEEMQSLLANDTWSLCYAPDGIKPIPVKWVFKLKRDPDGNIERYKARLVAKGFKQEEGVNYSEVFSPVSKYSTFRALIAKAAADDLLLHQLDIKTAFLQGELEEEIYIQLPPGYEESDPKLVCHLHKPLYGLKQAPRAWHQRFDSELIQYGFKVSSADPGMYVLSDPVDGQLYLLVYVDDILLASRSLSLITKVKRFVLDTFDGRDLGDAVSYLGITITRDDDGIKIGNRRMVADLAAQYGMADCNPRSLPMSTGIDFTASSPLLDLSVYPYRQLLGSLMHLCVTVRPDLAHSVGVLARHMANPTLVHWNAAKGVLRYVIGNPDAGIRYKKGSIGIVGYCDADFAADLATRRSTTGYVFMIGGGAVSWQSKRQPTVAASTTEAEYQAAASAVKEALWLRKLLSDLDIVVGAVAIKIDNQSALKLLYNPISSARSKHIDVVHHFARERVLRNEVSFEYVNTADQVADILTKPLPSSQHNLLCMRMGME